MVRAFFDRDAPRRAARPLAVAGALTALLLVSACSGGSPTNDDRAPAGGTSSVEATLAALPVPFTTPNAEALTGAAEPLGGGDYGIADAGSGSLKGTLASKGLSCDNDGFLHVDTDEGGFVAGVVSAGDWNCEKALGEWQRVNPSSGSVGIRYLPSPGSDTILIVNDAGGSMTLRVSGAWKVG